MARRPDPTMLDARDPSMAGLSLACLLLTTSCITDTARRTDDRPHRRPVDRQPVDVEALPVTSWVPAHVDAPVDPTPAIERASQSIGEASRQAAHSSVGWQTPLPDAAPVDRILADEPVASGSVATGPSGDGDLVDATKLPLEGPHHSVIERHRKRNTNWGTDELVELTREAAADVADEFPESTLRVGNLGRRGGGAIYWSNSHTNGRDADFAFYCRSAETGERVVAPDLVSFGPDGRGRDRPDLEFDVPRNWALVESLLTHPKADLQWLFISNALKEKLLNYAESEGVDDDIVARAKKVLHQPTDAPPHDDHLHVRITCPRGDRLAGCLNWGPRWDWVDWHRDDLLARSKRLFDYLVDSDAESVSRRLAALDELERIRSPFAPEVALALLDETENRRVRRRALEVAEEVGKWSVAAIAEVAELLDSDRATLEEKRLGYAILRQEHSRRARRIAFDRLLDETVAPAERRYAARALRHRMEPGLVPSLLDELAVQPPSVRAEIAVVLRRITGYSAETAWAEATSRDRRQALAEWKTWWNNFGDQPREEWLERALRRHGADVDDPDSLRAVDNLIPLLTEAPDHVAYNANRLIHRATDRWIPLESWSYRRLQRYWRNWWGDNRSRLLARR